MNASEIIKDLKANRNSKSIEGMTRHGINPDYALGLSIPYLRDKAKKIGIENDLALELWSSGIHEVRILATMISDPIKVTKSQMNSWVNDFNSWDLCDQCCNNLFRKTEYAIEYSFHWTKSKKEFVKRAGFAMIAVLAVHNKKLKNEDFQKYFPLIISNSNDDRNFVMKAVNWALRQIGKRNLTLNREAIKICKELLGINTKSSIWIGKNALTELQSPKILARIK